VTADAGAAPELGGVPLRRSRRRRGAWLLRVACIGSVVPLATLLDRDAGLALGMLAAFAWVPASSAIDLWQLRAASPLADVVAVTLDWSLLIGLALAVPEAAAMVVLAQLPLVVWWGAVDIRRFGIPAILLAVVPVIIALQNYSAPRPIVVGAPFVLAVVTGGLFWLQQELNREHQTTAASLNRLHRRASAILTGIGEAVIVTDAAGRLREINPAGLEILGLPEDVPGRHCGELLALRSGLRQLDCRDGCALLTLRGADSGDAEVSRTLPNGVQQPMLAGAQVVGEGSFAEVVHSFRDITRLRQAEEAKSLFLATASHELKTPITVIQGFTEILLADRAHDHETSEAALRAIHRRARELARIVDRMLLSSRIEHGRVHLDNSPIRVGPVLAERVQSLDAVLTSEILLALDQDLPFVLGDATALATVIDHLLENAAKYSPDHAPVRITARRISDGVEIDVADRGIGMTPEQVEHCFEQFWQAEVSDIREYGGTGIGLYIVQSLVAAMHGTVRVASTVGEGTTFTVELTSRVPTRTESAGGDPVDSQLSPPEAAESIIQEFMRQIGVGASEGGP